jgi:uncharacterized protein YjlB
MATITTCLTLRANGIPPAAQARFDGQRVEEVVAVHDGAATFYLGEQQARIVRAGEIVRIPAGISHRWVARPGGLRAVAAYAADRIVTNRHASTYRQR